MSSLKKQKVGKKIVAIDQGTTSSRALVFDEDLKKIASAQEEFPQIYPKPGWVEHDPQAILKSVKNCLTKLVQDGYCSRTSTAGIGLANQRETTVCWDRTTAKPLHNAIVWLDLRTHDVVRKIIGKGTKDKFRKSTGLPVATYFSAVKIKWLLENVPAVAKAQKEGRACFGTIDCWMVYAMTGGKSFVTDISNASRYMLMDLKKKAWDPAICKELGIDMKALPEIVSNVAEFGKISGKFCKDMKDVPICGSLGDQHAALVGQGCFGVGEAKNTYGTGCFMIANTGCSIIPSKKGLLTTVAYDLQDGKTHYALEGSVAVAGRLMQWLRDNLKIINDASEVEEHAKKCDNTGGVTLVPAFQGLFAPYWRDDARASLSGMTLQATKAHVCRAAIEAVAFQVVDVFDAMAGDGMPVKELRVDGGMTVNSTLMAMQADLLGAPIVRPDMGESTALGAGIAAAIGAGIFTSLDQIKKLTRAGVTEFKPKMKQKERQEAIARWRKAVMKTFDDDKKKGKL